MKRLFVLYKITNKINGRYYIGKSYKDRLEQGYLGSGPLIRSAVKKYGKENFTVDILQESTNEQEIFEQEAKIVTESSCYPTNPLSYNLQPGGVGGVQGRVYMVRDGKCRAVIGEINIQKYLEEGWVFGNLNSGRKCSEETRKKISERRKGTKWTEEQKKRASEQRKGHSHTPLGLIPVYLENIQRRIHPDQLERFVEEGWKQGILPSTKEKAAKKNRGQKRSEETKENLRKAWERRRLVPISEETREKHRRARLGIKFDSATCKKIQESKLGKCKLWKDGRGKYFPKTQRDLILSQGEYFETRKESLNHGAKQ